MRSPRAQAQPESGQDVENDISVIPFDDMGPKPKEDKFEKIDSLPILVKIDRKTKWVLPHMVQNKWHHAHSIKAVAREIR